MRDYKRILLGAVVIAAAAFLLGAVYGQRRGKANQNSARILYYVDPMNPAHISDHAGKAPCGMDMEPVYADNLGEASKSHAPTSLAGTVQVTPTKQQIIGVRTVPCENKSLTNTARLLGKVAADETRVYRINSTVDGWITKSLPNATGSYVKRDETLAQFYSPEFLAAGQALLFALGSKDRAQRQVTGQENLSQQAQMNQFDINLKQYRDSLRNLGMGQLQIDEMIRTRKFIENVNITSPADGFILLRNVSEGQRFEKGTELFRIADLSRVWIVVDVFEKDATVVQPDQPITVRLPSQGKTFMAILSKTLPQFDNITRTLKLRLEAENPDFALKPDMFVDVELPMKLPEALLVPAEAILDAGLRQTVYVDLGNGYFEPRNVQVGSRIGDVVQVVHGLAAGERVVTSGSFLLDSESRMKMAAAGMMAAPASDPVCKMAVEETAAKATGRHSEYQGKSYYFCSDGCKKKFDADPAKSLAKQNPRPMAAPVAQPVTAIDPVCKMKVEPAEAEAAKLTTEHQGKTYYFCNPGCKKTFLDEPSKYLGSTAAISGEMKTSEATQAPHAH